MELKFDPPRGQAADAPLPPARKLSNSSLPPRPCATGRQPVASVTQETADSPPWSQLAREPDVATRLKPPPSVVPYTGPACDDVKARASSESGATVLPKRLESLGHLMNPGALDAAVQGVMADQHRRHSLRNHKRVSRISEPWGAANEEGPLAVRDDSGLSSAMSETWMPLGSMCSTVSIGHEEGRPVAARELAHVLIRSCYTRVAARCLKFVPKQESRRIAKVILVSVYRSAMLLLSTRHSEPEPHTKVGGKLPILCTGLRARHSGEGFGLGGARQGETTPIERKKATVKFLLEEAQDEEEAPPHELEDNIKADPRESTGSWKRRATGAVSQLAFRPALLNGSGPFYLHSDEEAQEAEEAIRDLTRNVLRLCYALAAGKEAAKRLSTLCRSAEEEAARLATFLAIS